MAEETKRKAPTPPEAGRGEPRPGYIPKPPSRAELEQVSRDQALITDEWTGDEPKPPG